MHRNVYKLAVIVLVQFNAYSIVLLVYTCTVQHTRSNCTRGRHSESAGVCVLIVCQHTIVCVCSVLVNSVLLLLFMLYVRVFRSLEYHVCTSINVITINAHTGTYVCTYVRT